MFLWVVEGVHFKGEMGIEMGLKELRIWIKSLSEQRWFSEIHSLAWLEEESC